MASCRRGLWVAAVDGLRQRVDIVMGTRGLSVDEITMTDAHSRVNGDGRHECGRGGARGWRTGDGTGGNQDAHNGGRGGARAHGTGIVPMTIMRPALQCGH